MVFNRTSILRARGPAAFTLVEYVVAMSIGLIVLGAACVLWGFASVTTAGLLNYVELSMTSKNALESISREIRNAVAVQSFSASRLVLLDPSRQQVTLSYDSVSQTLRQTKGTEQKTILSGCSSFEFKVFQRTPTSGSDTMSEATDTNTAKVVQMQWACARKQTGDKQNVENLVSSKVVIRSK